MLVKLKFKYENLYNRNEFNKPYVIEGLNNGCIVNVLSFSKKTTNYSTRTVGISNSNISFIKNNIINLQSKKFHNIKKITIFSKKKREIIKFYKKGEN